MGYSAENLPSDLVYRYKKSLRSVGNVLLWFDGKPRSGVINDGVSIGTRIEYN